MIGDGCTRRQRVLIVDGDRTTRDAAFAALTARDWIARTAARGEEALAIIREGFAPDLILLAWTMPEMRGADLLQVLTIEVDPLPAICILTAAGERVPQGLAVLEKPIGEASLLRAAEALPAH